MEEIESKILLRNPVEPLDIDAHSDIGGLLRRMGETAFQGKNLAVAVQVWSEMLKEDVAVFLGLAGAMVPAGMGSLVNFLIENRLVECMGSTGGNPSHDSPQAQ